MIHLNHDGPLSIASFERSEFIRRNLSVYEAYVDLRAHGYNAVVAFARTFGHVIRADSREVIMATEVIERTRYFQVHYEQMRAAIPAADLWTSRDAVDILSEMAKDSRAPQGVRLAAYRELNKVLARIEADEAKRMPASVSEVIKRAKVGSGNG